MREIYATRARSLNIVVEMFAVSCGGAEWTGRVSGEPQLYEIRVAAEGCANKAAQEDVQVA